MRIQFWSVGKPHEPYVKTGIDDFTGRVNKYFKADWNLVPPVRNAASLSEPELMKKEAQLILASLLPDDYLVLMDERGKQLSSEGLAVFIQARANESSKRVIFLIGGAFGVDESVARKADFTWSLSNLVFPHQLVRLILTEQVYRACTILRNEKYHHK